MGTRARVVVLPQKQAPLRIEEITLPDPGPTQVIVRQFASGICHSQLHQMHRPRETPVILGHEATGIIEKAGYEGGYGKYIRIRHANGWETAYGHMSAFARGMETGKKVRQGQLIGYVGSTGLSTGNHLHYEMIVNGRFVDPMKIKLPRGRVLEGGQLAGFEEERARLDQMLTRATPSRYAQGR